jgi:hypothetical protein
MLSSDELDRLLKLIPNPVSWNWKEKKGFFKKKKFVILEDEIKKTLSKLEKSNDSLSLEQAHLIRVNLKSAHGIFLNKDFLEQANVIGRLLGLGIISSGKVWSPLDVPLEFYSERSDKTLQMPDAVEFALSQGSVLQSAREAVIKRMSIGKDDFNYYYNTRTVAIYYVNEKGEYCVAFDDDAFDNILLSRAEEGRQAEDKWFVKRDDYLVNKAIKNAEMNNRIFILPQGIDSVAYDPKINTIQIAECILGDKSKEYYEANKNKLTIYFVKVDGLKSYGVNSSTTLCRLVGLRSVNYVNNLNAGDRCYINGRARGVQKISSGNGVLVCYLWLFIFKKINHNKPVDEMEVKHYFDSIESKLKDKKVISSFYQILGFYNKFINSKQDLDDFVTKIIELMSEYSNRFLVALFKKITDMKVDSFGEIEKMLPLALAYWDLLGESEYTIKLIFENLDKLRPLDAKINKLSFEKTGSELIPLGGKLAGFLFRIIKKESYLTWVAAEKVLKEKKNGKIINHCEPIVRAYNRKNGFVSVVTKYSGQAVRSYLVESEAEYKEIEQQINWIKERLEENRIDHGHDHMGNFVVRKEDGMTIVSMIDFDMASSSD